MELRRRAYGVDRDGDPICTQAEFAAALRLSNITVSRWELGKQDPPPRERARLALAAENLGAGQDLTLAFRSGQEQDYVLRKTDLAIVGLLRCLFLARESSMNKSNAEELQGIAKGVFDFARAVAGDAITSDMIPPTNRILIDEMVRLLKEIDLEENSPFFGQMARLFGARTYTEPEKGGAQ